MSATGQTLTFNGKDYAFDSLSPQAKAQLNNIRVVEFEIRRLETSLEIFKTARAAYVRALKQELEKGNLAH